MIPAPLALPYRVTIRAAIAPLHAEARVSSPQVSQLLRGHDADAVIRNGDWLRLRGADGYEGWCHVGYLRDLRNDPAPLRPAWGRDAHISLGCVVRRADGSTVPLPLGALLGAGETLVTGTGLAMNARARGRYFAPDPALLVERGRALFAGAPYQWGGVTPWGADCSGFVQTMFALHGTQLPRDAWQQGECGTDAGSEPGDLRAGDLLFFSDRDDGKITHVAISTGGATVLHCSLANGGFGVNALLATDPVALVLRRTFRFARRVV